MNHIFSQDKNEYSTEKADFYKEKILNAISPILDEMDNEDIPSYEIIYFIQTQIDYYLANKRIMGVIDNNKEEKNE